MRTNACRLGGALSSGSGSSLGLSSSAREGSFSASKCLDTVFNAEMMHACDHGARVTLLRSRLGTLFNHNFHF